MCSYELLQHNFRKKILSVKMSDIENRPPTSVMATKTGPKDSNIKPKENIVKSKVKWIVFSFKMTYISIFSRIVQVAPAEKSFKPCSRLAKTRLYWWVFNILCHWKFSKADDNYQFKHGASPCSHIVLARLGADECAQVPSDHGCIVHICGIMLPGNPMLLSSNGPETNS